MQESIDIKSLWHKQTEAMPDINALREQLARVRESGIRKVILTNLLLGTTTFFIVYIWIIYQPAFFMTKVGIALVISAMALYLLVSNKLLLTYEKIDSTLSNKRYLANLLELKNRQRFIHTRVMSLYFILLSIGISLYMVEYTQRMTFFWALTAYVLTLSWIAFNWFYTRPRSITKQQKEVNDLLVKLEQVNVQMEGGDSSDDMHAA